MLCNNMLGRQHTISKPCNSTETIGDTISFYLAYWALYRKLKEQELLNQLRRTFVNAALDCCIQSWRARQEPEIKDFIEKKLRAHIFREMELNGYEKSYYYKPAHYEDMQAILGDAAAQEVRRIPGKKIARGPRYIYIYIWVYRPLKEALEQIQKRRKTANAGI